MIEACYVFALDLYYVDPGIRSVLAKKYGSKRSGTVYIVANCQGEADEIGKLLFTSNGYAPPKKLYISRTDHIKQILRLIS